MHVEVPIGKSLTWIEAVSKTGQISERALR
jgi:hypothetical protein